MAKIKVSDYEAFVKANGFIGIKDDKYNVIGLCGESGEVAEWVKKVVCRKAPSKLTELDLKKELGDVLHYVTRIAINHKWTLKEIMLTNVLKLQARRKKRTTTKKRRGGK